jgi:transaldolase
VASYSFYSIREVIAAAELGCHSVTLSPTILDELSNTNYDTSLDPGVEVLKSEIVNRNATAAPKRLQHLLSTDPLASPNFVPARTDVDYLSNGGAELERALLKDPPGNNRLRDAIALFVRAEAASKLLIEGVLSHGTL